ncbi:MAG: response regulator [Silicimonas sp.]|nr:response regulator [Silicimonas sp.]
MQNSSLVHAPDDTTSDSAARGMRLLVIDDNELDRQRLIRLCDKAGMRFEATEVEGLADLPEALDACAYDIIFIDYFLAGDTGLEALEIISAHEGQVNAASIMLAGEGQINIAVEAMRQGCSDYLTKAMMNVDTLQKSVATALERRLMMEELAHAKQSREEVEASILNYARACTAEMREILSGTLRRVRKLRNYKAMENVDYVVDLHSLETEIDKLWGAFPDFAGPALTNGKAPEPQLLEQDPAEHHAGAPD